MKKAAITMSTDALPCREDPELWFAEAPADLERAKALCAACPVRLVCLAVAIDHKEVAGVWGGHIIERGRIVARKRARGRPRKDEPAYVFAPMPKRDAPVGERRSAVQLAAQQLYDAECALHAAHGSGVDEWVAAANKKLHAAVREYLAALQAARRARRTPRRTRVNAGGGGRGWQCGSARQSRAPRLPDRPGG